MAWPLLLQFWQIFSKSLPSKPLKSSALWKCNNKLLEYHFNTLHSSPPWPCERQAAMSCHWLGFNWRQCTVNTWIYLLIQNCQNVFKDSTHKVYIVFQLLCCKVLTYSPPHWLQFCSCILPVLTCLLFVLYKIQPRPSRVGWLINFLTLALMVGIINMYEVMLHIPNQISVHNREHWMGWCIIHLHTFYFFNKGFT